MTHRNGGLRRAAIYSASFLLIGLIFYAAAPLWMSKLGWFLVSSDSPAAADAAVVLAGDGLGERLMTAVFLMESKLVPKVVVSGPKGAYGTWESDLAIDWAVQQGKPREWFVPVRIDADSTMEEAKTLLPWLKQNQVNRVAVVTSNFHSRRTGKIWRSLASGIEVRVIAAPCRDFDPDRWWKSRRMQKTFAFEWQKTIGNWAGL
jgi:uncharacterized SAM-binding protein YcdF (DUF218 family)